MREDASEYLTPAEREALAEMALLYGTFLMGRFAEVMSAEQEPADDWQEQAALEAVDLFGPGARQMLDASKAEALELAADVGPSSTATDQLWRMWIRDRAAALRAEKDLTERVKIAAAIEAHIPHLQAVPSVAMGLRNIAEDVRRGVVRMSGLTEAEKNAIHDATGDYDTLFAAVERLLAARQAEAWDEGAEAVRQYDYHQPPVQNPYRAALPGDA